MISKEIHSLIQSELTKLEQQYDIKILYAVESGSRAWGFESTNSDYDVRYIYIHKPEWYLSIDDKKDSHEVILPNDIDLAGWELRKALRLFRKSNPPLLEWLKSYIVYKESSEIQILRYLHDLYFNPKSCIYHYLHMAQGNYDEYLKKDNVKLKRYFYVLRPILGCEWIERYNTSPPILFHSLVDTLIKNSDLRQAIEKLLIQKKHSEELDYGPRIPIINNFLQDRIDYYSRYVKDLPKQIHPLADNLDKFFRTTLYANCQNTN